MLSSGSTPPAQASRRPQRPPRPLFYGWWVVLAGAGMQLLQGTVLGQAYGAYVVVLRAEFGWSKTLLSGASALREMESGLIGPIQGWLVDRVGPRWVARAGVLLLALGLFMFSRMHDPATFYVAFVVMALGGSLMGYLTITSTIVQFFERRRSTALSVASLGGGLGGVLLPFTVVAAIEAFGWRQTALLSSVAVLLIGLPLTQVLRRSPAELGLRPDGDPAWVDGEELPEPLSDSFTLREALRAPSFWWVSFGHGSALFVVSAVNVHLLPHLTESLGYSLTGAAGVFSLVTACFMIGTMVGGFVGDYASKRWLAFGCMIGHMVGLLLISHATGGTMVIAGAIIHGLAWGARGPQMAAIRADYFGVESFGKIIGVSNLVIIIGTIVGPLVAGYVYDTTGNYRIGFDILSVMSGAGSIFFVLATRPKPPPRLAAVVD